MKVCPNCHRKYDSDAFAFCKACGTRLVDFTESVDDEEPKGSTSTGASAEATAVHAPVSSSHLPKEAAGHAGATSAAAVPTVGTAFAELLNVRRPQKITVACDGKALYAQGIVLTLDNVSDLSFVADRPGLTWWMKLLLVCAFSYLVLPTLNLMGASVGDFMGTSDGGFYVYFVFPIAIVVVAYLVRRWLADKTITVAMSSGDKAKVVSMDEADLQKGFARLSEAVVNRKVAQYTFSLAELRLEYK